MPVPFADLSALQFVEHLAHLRLRRHSEEEVDRAPADDGGHGRHLTNLEGLGQLRIRLPIDDGEDQSPAVRLNDRVSFETDFGQGSG